MFTDSRKTTHDLMINDALKLVIGFARKGVFDPEQHPDLQDIIESNHTAINKVEAFAERLHAGDDACALLEIPERRTDWPAYLTRQSPAWSASLPQAFRITFDKARWFTVSRENAATVGSDEAFFRQLAAIEMVEEFFVQNRDALEELDVAPRNPKSPRPR